LKILPRHAQTLERVLEQFAQFPFFLLLDGSLDFALKKENNGKCLWFFDVDTDGKGRVLLVLESGRLFYL
jgi:hypothetical protein